MPYVVNPHSRFFVTASKFGLTPQFSTHTEKEESLLDTHSP